MPATVRALIRHVADETLAPQGAVLKLALSVPAALEPRPVKLAYRRATGPDRAAEPAAPGRARRAVRRHRALAPALAKAAKVGAGVLKAMAEAGLLVPSPLVSARPGRVPIRSASASS